MYAYVAASFAISAAALVVALVLAILRQRDTTHQRRTWNALIVIFLVFAFVPILVLAVVIVVAIALFLDRLGLVGD